MTWSCVRPLWYLRAGEPAARLLAAERARVRDAFASELGFRLTNHYRRTFLPWIGAAILFPARTNLPDKFGGQVKYDVRFGSVSDVLQAWSALRQPLAYVLLDSF